jgi:2-dehydro-3-deoxyphosphooctonate aldolase (KDO 8-P synthase)
MEVHDNPANAPSDGPNQLPLGRLEKLLRRLKDIHELINSDHTAII